MAVGFRLVIISVLVYHNWYKNGDRPQSPSFNNDTENVPTYVF